NGLAGRDQASHGSYCDYQERDTRYHKRIDGAVFDPARDETTKRKAERRTQNQSQANAGRRRKRNQAQDVRATRAEGHANAEFAGALSDAVRHDAVEAY